MVPGPKNVEKFEKIKVLAPLGLVTLVWLQRLSEQHIFIILNLVT